MLDRDLGLTALYNQVNNFRIVDAGIARLREIHVEIDRAVAEAYDWADLNLDHGFHETAQGVRFTISEPARREVLNRLLQLNHRRHTEEVASGVAASKGRHNKRNSGQMELVEA
jgi:DNA-binding GntR family transcriptional regulator